MYNRQWNVRRGIMNELISSPQILVVLSLSSSLLVAPPSTSELILLPLILVLSHSKLQYRASTLQSLEIVGVTMLLNPAISGDGWCHHAP